MKRLARRPRRRRSRSRRRVAASAHPLGNFTINRYSRARGLGQPRLRALRARPGGDPDLPGEAARRDRRRRVRQADRRERAPRRSTAAGPARPAAARARVSAGRRRAAHHAARGRSSRGPRLTGRARISYRDTNYAGRIGWKEIVVPAAGTANAAAATSCSRIRRTCSQSPLDVTELAADARRRRREPPSDADQRQGARRRPTRVADSGFASLIVHDHLSIGFVLALAADRVLLGRRARALARATASRSSPPTSSARAARRGTRSASG